MLTLRDYQNAVQVQDACNISGVVRSLSDTLSRMSEMDTESKTCHPIVNMYLCKLASLQGQIYDWEFTGSYQFCQDVIEGKRATFGCAAPSGGFLSYIMEEGSLT
jgi:hypothetical protein